MLGGTEARSNGKYLTQKYKDVKLLNNVDNSLEQMTSQQFFRRS